MKKIIITVVGFVVGGMVFVGLTNCAQPTGQPSSFVKDTIYSSALQQHREYCVYLPEQFSAAKKYPVIFATDGQMIAACNYKQLLDSLIANRVISPVVLVAAYANEQPLSGAENVTMRYIEYCKQGDGVEEDGEIEAEEDSIASFNADEIFEKHFDFFTREIKEIIVAKYAIRPSGKTIFYGCSNGGDFGMYLYLHRAGMFTDFICFSPVATMATDFEPKTGEATKLYVAYGTAELDVPWGDNLKELDEKLKAERYPNVNFYTYQGGHKRDQWKQEFATILSEIFNN